MELKLKSRTLTQAVATFEQRPPAIQDPFYEKIFVGEILEAKAAAKEKTTQIFQSLSKIVNTLEEKLQEKILKSRIVFRNCF